MLEAMSIGTPVKSLSSTLDSSTLSATVECQRSPILFDSDEESDETEESVSVATSTKLDESTFKLEVDVRDEKYIKRLRTTLAGIPPPPKFTIPQFSAAEMLEMYNKNAEESLSYLKDVDKTEDKVISEEMKSLAFPDSMKCLYYGIHFNRGPLSVEFESLTDKYRERYVGSETSCTVINKANQSNMEHLTNSAKKKARKHPWNYSPGRRLSHLARRRQIFTSASLPKAVMGNRTKASVLDSKRMIMLDKKKSSQSTTRSKLSSLTLSSHPSSSLSYPTMPILKPQVPPSSSSYSQMPSLKRALFQSPDCFSREATARLSEAEKETPRTDKMKARRALFSSGTKKERTPCKKTPNKKTPNKRTPRQGGYRLTPHKGTPTSSKKKTPRKSLFADPDDRNGLSSRDLFNVNGKRPRSESLLNLHGDATTTRSVTLSADEKKKLLWVVYHCLKERKITTKNTLYRACQNYLYRLCSDEWKAQLAEQPVSIKIKNVSEKMLNIARRHVSGVILKVKNNQSFYRSSSSQTKDNGSESGETCLTSVSHPDASRTNPEPSDCKSTGQKSICEDKSDLESIAKSDYDRESICVRSDIDYAKSECSSINRFRESSSSCLADEESNTTGSGVFVATETNTMESGMYSSDSVMSGHDTNTSSSILLRQDSNHSKDSVHSSSKRSNEASMKNPGSKRDSNTIDTNTKDSSALDTSSTFFGTSTVDSNNSKETVRLEDNCSVPPGLLVDTSDTSDKTDSSVPAPPMFTLTSPFIRQAKGCKVILNGISNEKNKLEDLASMYDEETRF